MSEPTLNQTLLRAADLLQRVQAAGAGLLCLDCSFDLADTDAGERSFQEGHLPGAVHLHLDRDLSAARTGRNGRHPLPSPDAFAQRIAAIGGGPDSFFVCYDRSGGMYAARAWWMLRWAGHAGAAVLDGGWQAWLRAGGPVEAGPARPRAASRFALRPALEATVAYGELQAGLARPVDQRQMVVDARAADRFRGENETLDPVGGHIPGARNRPFRDNLAADGGFKPAAQLRTEWSAVLDGRVPADVVQQCGSGVTACHNLLALHLAGLGGSALYPGSWSEWCAQPGAPIATGADPG
ncbi:MAG: sulfurtransferase [Aquabacterium sp.]